MRTRWVGVLVGVGLIFPGAAGAAGPGATARAVPTAGAARHADGFAPVGSLDYVWKGDPARGCAAEGLCGVLGSLQVVTGNSSESGGPGLPPIDLQDDAAVARVLQSAPDGEQHVCVDRVPYDGQFDVRHGPAGKLRAVPEVSGQPASSGRCAGPTAADLESVALPARKLGRRGYDLSGSFSLGAGPFTVTVISTIHALFVTSQFPPGPAPATTVVRVPEPRLALAEQAEVVYRVVGAQGQLMTSFSGLGQPFCTPLDACGMTGTVGLAVRAMRGQDLDFSGARVVKRRVGAGQALADLHAGRLRLSNTGSSAQLGGELTGTLGGANAAPCRDTVSASSLDLGEGVAHGGYRLLLGPSGSAPAFFGPDELRTRCPGPGSSEISGMRSLAAGVVAARALGARSLRITLSGARQFRGTAYAGTRSGSLVVTLVRTHEFGGTRRIGVFRGQVLG